MKKTRYKPHRVISHPMTIRLYRAAHKPKQDRYWTYTAGALALSANAFHYIDHDIGDHTMLNPAYDGNCAHTQQPDEHADRTLTKQALSNEAKYVLNTILNAPSEVLQLIQTPKLGRITLPRLVIYLRKQIGWDNKRVDEAINELRNYVVNL